MIRSDRIDYQVCPPPNLFIYRSHITKLIAVLVEHIINTAEKRRGILIFLPGVNEIRQCVTAIRQTVQQKDTLVLPLHANLSNSEQKKVFESTKSWKIIAATNVAEVGSVLVVSSLDSLMFLDIYHHRRRHLCCGRRKGQGDSVRRRH